MLRINLLPIRQLKKRAKARNQIFAFIALLTIVLFILGSVGFIQFTRVKVIENSIAKLNIEKKKLDPILAEIKALNLAKAELNKKIEIVKTLKNNSAMTVHILDEVAKNMDNKRMWLTTLKQQGQTLSLQGTALDNRTIAQFMDALKRSPYITAVNLSNASLKQVSGRDLKSFSLACAITSPEKEKKKDETAKLN